MEKSLPVNRLSQIMRNRGLFCSQFPNTPSELVHAIEDEGNIAYCMFRSLVASMVSYEMSLCLRQEPELYRWVWLCPCGEILKRGSIAYKNEDDCLADGYINMPPYIHVCIESVPDKRECAIILV